MIKGLDRFGKPLGAIDFIEASWNRRWSGCGEFMVYMAAKDYDPDIKYIQNVGRPELGIIQKYEQIDEVKGMCVTLSGFFIEKLADWGAYRKAVSMVASGPVNVKTAINGYLTNALAGRNGKKCIGGYSIDDDSVFPASIDINITNGTEAGTALYNILADSGYSYYCKPIWGSVETSPLIGLDFVFRKGGDLTSGTNAVYFGTAYNNVESINYTLDESAERALYEVMQKSETTSGWGTLDFSFTEVVDGKAIFRIGKYYSYNNNRPTGVGDCYPVKVLETSLSDIEIVPANKTAILAQMDKEAQLDMLNNYKVESINTKVLQERFKYLTDYDLGDKCVVSIDELEQMYYVRIEEINETHHNNMIDVELVLGTPSKQKWRKV